MIMQSGSSRHGGLIKRMPAVLTLTPAHGITRSVALLGLAATASLMCLSSSAAPATPVTQSPNLQQPRGLNPTNGLPSKGAKAVLNGSGATNNVPSPIAPNNVPGPIAPNKVVGPIAPNKVDGPAALNKEKAATPNAPGIVREQQNDQRVTLCHNGRTIVVGQSGVAEHLAHGDTLGACDSPTTTVCHNGQTITINRSALADHLAHGDTPGPCVVTEVNNR